MTISILDAASLSSAPNILYSEHDNDDDDNDNNNHDNNTWLIHIFDKHSSQVTVLDGSNQHLRIISQKKS